MNGQQLTQLLVCLGLLSGFAVGGVVAHNAQFATESVETQDTGDLPADTTIQATDDRTGEDAGAQDADIQIRSISAPATVQPDEDLTVDYTLENVGGTNGTESFVDLLVNGTDSGFDDTDEDVSVPAGGTASGTLTFDNVSGFSTPVTQSTSASNCGTSVTSRVPIPWCASRSPSTPLGMWTGTTTSISSTLS
jgi:hypothetical protein